MKIYFQIVTVCGFLISLYALIVRHKMHQSESYSPLCDIHFNISCSKALGSRYSKTLGIPNPLAGLFFYTFLFLLSFWFIHLTLFPAAAAVLFSFYLAYISYIKQKNFCLLCTLTYLVNITLLIIAVMM
jgi:uncharacterized membrane protein